ncbi:Gfo/Idh/MocA family protein [Subtercola frigoramans]
MVGHAFMGAAHSHAWRNAARVFDLPLEPRMVAVAGTSPERTAAAAQRLGWSEAVTDWRELIERDDIDVIDICTPSDTHREIAVAALAAGKHVLCEKPLANSLAEADEMAEAARKAAELGIWASCGFTYRRQPAVALARQLIQDGSLGTIRHVRVTYLQDWLSNEKAEHSWRLDASRSGSGALGDLGAHAIDLAQWVLGEKITTLSARTRIFVDARPSAGSGNLEPVTVDDAAFVLAEFSDGVIGTIEASRYALGRKNAFGFEINGSNGSVAWEFERNNELQRYDGGADPRSAGFTRVLVTEPSHPYLQNWWPAGHTLGYDHAFVNQAADFVTSICAGLQPTPSFADAAYVQRVLSAVQLSENSHQWQAV